MAFELGQEFGSNGTILVSLNLICIKLHLRGRSGSGGALYGRGVSSIGRAIVLGDVSVATAVYEKNRVPWGTRFEF